MVAKGKKGKYLHTRTTLLARQGSRDELVKTAAEIVSDCVTLDSEIIYGQGRWRWNLGA